MMQPDPLTHGADLASWSLLLLLVTGIVLLIGIIKLFKHGNAAFIGTVLFGLAIVPLFLLGVCLLGMWVGYQSVAEVPEGVHQAIDGVEHVTDNLTNTLGDLEKKLDEFTKPQIDLGEKSETPATKEEQAEESATELPTEPKLGEPLPDWVTDPPEAEEGVWQRVVSTEPSFTLESLARTQKELVRETLAKYWPEHVDEVLPEGFSRWLDNRSDQPGVILNQHTEHRETSVGEAFVSHVLFRVGKPENEWFSQQWKAWKAEERLANRGMRVAGIGLLSGAVLCVLAMLYGLLWMSEK